MIKGLRRRPLDVFATLAARREQQRQKGRTSRPATGPLPPLATFDSVEDTARHVAIQKAGQIADSAGRRGAQRILEAEPAHAVRCPVGRARQLTDVGLKRKEQLSSSS